MFQFHFSPAAFGVRCFCQKAALPDVASGGAMTIIPATSAVLTTTTFTRHEVKALGRKTQEISYQMLLEYRDVGLWSTRLRHRRKLKPSRTTQSGSPDAMGNLADLVFFAGAYADPGG